MFQIFKFRLGFWIRGLIAKISYIDFNRYQYTVDFIKSQSLVPLFTKGISLNTQVGKRFFIDDGSSAELIAVESSYITDRGVFDKDITKGVWVHDNGLDFPGYDFCIQYVTTETRPMTYLGNFRLEDLARYLIT